MFRSLHFWKASNMDLRLAKLLSSWAIIVWDVFKGVAVNTSCRLDDGMRDHIILRIGTGWAHLDDTSWFVSENALRVDHALWVHRHFCQFNLTYFLWFLADSEHIYSFRWGLGWRWTSVFKFLVNNFLLLDLLPACGA